MIDDLTDATWDRELNDLFLRIGHRFGRADLRRRMCDYVRALLGPVARKNGWQLAGHAGHHTPDGLQRLLKQGNLECRRALSPDFGHIYAAWVRVVAAGWGSFS